MAKSHALKQKPTRALGILRKRPISTVLDAIDNRDGQKHISDESSESNDNITSLVVGKGVRHNDWYSVGKRTGHNVTKIRYKYCKRIAVRQYRTKVVRRVRSMRCARRSHLLSPISLSPQLQNSVPSPFREAAALEDVVQV